MTLRNRQLKLKKPIKGKGGGDMTTPGGGGTQTNNIPIVPHCTLTNCTIVNFNNYTVIGGSNIFVASTSTADISMFINQSRQNRTRNTQVFGNSSPAKDEGRERRTSVTEGVVQFPTEHEVSQSTVSVVEEDEDGRSSSSSYYSAEESLSVEEKILYPNPKRLCSVL